MAWSLKANYYESCNCELGCPCNMSGFPSHGFCEAAVAFEVTAGEREGVALAGAKVAFGAKWPGAIHEGNGTMIVFIDASEEQVAALGPILTAEDPGLPFEIMSAMCPHVHGPFLEPVTISGTGTGARVSVGGGKFDVQMQAFTDPVSGEKHEPHMILQDGFIFQDGIIATTTTMTVNHDGVSLDHKGKNAYYSEVEWSSENRMAPAAV